MKSLKDTWLDLSKENPYSQFLITVMAGVNQLERDLIRMRQREGIELAKKEGKFKGRLKKYHKNHAGMNYAVKLYKEGNMTVNQICEITNVSRSSLYRNLSKGDRKHKGYRQQFKMLMVPLIVKLSKKHITFFMI